MDIFSMHKKASQSQKGYCVDLAILIDGTGSMDHIIEEVKNSALSFSTNFRDAMTKSGRNIAELRIKVIVFRDYKYDGPHSMYISKFFVLPEEERSFKDFVDNIEADGGGDYPENSLEALALAMQSDWTQEGARRRHVILLFTDASAVELNDPERTINPTYPENMPQNMAQLTDMWAGEGGELGGMPEEKAARLVIVGPKDYPWEHINKAWDNVWFSQQKIDGGLDEMNMALAIKLLVNSIA